ncbi:hypothetical protein F4554_005540 [Actinopolymorpha rutila]|uniref:Uncharacterized protein n=1 Tax=Actinopolymorpha rutila TaxID=446787 RepID=A0A852ZMX6_9ACTN|nr:hypothetical protein [Actinopolymorpha rutila]
MGRLMGSGPATIPPWEHARPPDPEARNTWIARP